MCVLDSSMSFLDVLWMSINLLKMRSRCLYRSIAFHRFYLVYETVANARDGEDEARPLGERFDFLAQLRYIDM